MTATPQIKVYVTMRGSPTAQAAFAILRTFVACWCTRITCAHTLASGARSQTGRGGARSGAACPPS